MYTHTNIHYIHTHRHMYTYTYTHITIHTFYTCIDTITLCTHISTYINTHRVIFCVHTYTYIDTYTFTNIHTDIHVYIGTNIYNLDAHIYLHM